MFKVLESTETTGTTVFGDVDMPVSKEFAVAILNPANNTFPDDTFLEYAVAYVGGERIDNANLIWQRRSITKFADDSGATQGATIQLFNHVDGLVYRVVTGTAGIEAVVGQVV